MIGFKCVGAKICKYLKFLSIQIFAMLIILSSHCNHICPVSPTLFKFPKFSQNLFKSNIKIFPRIAIKFPTKNSQNPMSNIIVIRLISVITIKSKSLTFSHNLTTVNRLSRKKPSKTKQHPIKMKIRTYFL